jgi:hypothetical protein
MGLAVGACLVPPQCLGWVWACLEALLHSSVFIRKAQRLPGCPHAQLVGTQPRVLTTYHGEGVVPYGHLAV